MTLFWKAPEDDGNDEIIEYILEYRDKIQVNWTQITQITDTTFKVDKLKSDKEYEFRVLAVNSVGPSPPSPSSDFLRLTAPFDKEEPTIVEPLTDRCVGLRERIVLSTVIGGAPEPTVTWYKNKKIIKTEDFTYENRVTKYIIEETTIETEAEYTCVAKNEIGKAETTCKIIVQESPMITVEDRLFTQKLRKGTTYKITATITGFPEPEISWFKETKEITTDERVTITYKENICTLELNTIDRNDNGKYSIKAKNKAGEDYVEVHLKVIDKPEKPLNLDVKDVKKDSVVIEWTPPIDDGGLDITKYSIEKCDPEKLVWMKVAEVDKSIISYCVQKLLPNAQYLFRIIAENPIGYSEPTESDLVTITKKVEPPSVPRGPLSVSGMTGDSLVLAWQPPESDGGGKIINYEIEICDTRTESWTKIGVTDGNISHILAKDLRKESVYQFKIFARNEAGLSPPYMPDDKIAAGADISKWKIIILRYF